MTISGIGGQSQSMVRALIGMRTMLADLQRQMTTGKKTDSYAGLGVDRGLAVTLRAQLAARKGYNDSIVNAGTRIDIAQSALTRISAVGREIKTASGQMSSEGQRATAKESAKNAIDEILGLLNSQAGDRYLFSGLATDRPATETVDAILHGDNLRAGLEQVIAERKLADLGADGLGRLAVTAPASAAMQVEEDAASPFGFKLAGIASSLSGASVAAPGGSPQVMSVELAENPKAGETLNLSFTLPDGSTETVTLTATSSQTPAAGEFSICADPAETAENLRAATRNAIGGLARSSLTIASAIAASGNFFAVDGANSPLRVDGSPFESATALVAGTPENTVFWYKGEAGSQPARSTAKAGIDQSIAVDYGLRANEAGIAKLVGKVALLALSPFSESDPDIAKQSAALSARLSSALALPSGIDTIQAELAGARNAIKAAQTRHQESRATLADMLSGIEGVSNEEVAARILALQTRLEASLQTTAILYKTSLLNYI